MPVLQMFNASKVHNHTSSPVQALRGLNLTVEPGEMVAVMGPSGSGKSTLLNLAGGLDDPTSGSIRVSGQDLSGLNAGQRARIRRRNVGYVFQDFNLIPSLTAAENVAMPLNLDGVSWRRAKPMAQELLTELGLPDIANRFPDEISGGQRQRVAIARALVGNRSLMLADEPTGALDSATGEEILNLLRRRCDQGAACLLVTHESRHAAWADRILMLRDGLMVHESQYRGVSAELAGSML